jgi:superfamily II DNA/RNA helicase
MPKHSKKGSDSRRSRRQEDAPYESGEIVEDKKEKKNYGADDDKKQHRHGHHQHTNKQHGHRRHRHKQEVGATDEDTKPCSTFDEMNLKPDLLKGIYAYGFEKPSAIQQRAIRPILRGRDVIAQSQSGTGKTAVFSIASLQLLDETSNNVQVLVLSPTRELAEQSQRVMQSLGDFMNVRY